MCKAYFYLLLILFFSCSELDTAAVKSATKSKINSTSIVLLGTVQDAGSPQLGCKKKCCDGLFENPDHNRKVISLGIIDSENNKSYMVEATPDMVSQMKMITEMDVNPNNELVDGIFLTHAHIGHYTGLMYLGKEAINANHLPVYAMPKMTQFLNSNGPWSQLVSTKNIELQALQNEQSVRLSDKLTLTPFQVPHRDEFSETVAYKIEGPNKKALFIPDIDKWEKWDKDIIDEIAKVDYAFLDATFYSGKEINNRDISQIPHPFIIESLEKFRNLSDAEKNKIIFIHFNHTNPVLDPTSKESKWVTKQGFRIGRIKDVFEL